MKKVLFDGGFYSYIRFNNKEDFYGYSIDGGISIYDYFIDEKVRFRDNPKTFLLDLYSKDIRLFYYLTNAKGIDELYRTKNKYYMKFLCDYIDRHKGYDCIIINNNYVHPEVLKKELQKPIKILCFVDDPYSTYIRGVPYLWAVDGAVYISPSYGDISLFDQALRNWGCKNFRWWPLSAFDYNANMIDDNEDFYKNRELDIIYVGSQKTRILGHLKSHFGDRLKIYGRWTFKGYAGYLRLLKGQVPVKQRVVPISNELRTKLYYNTKIGFNAHLSNDILNMRMETGNARMYEIPAHGMMQVCDKAAFDAHELIFKPGDEAVFYDSPEDAIEKIEYYLSNEKERLRIARNGFRRYLKDYEYNKNLLDLINWAMEIKR